MHIENKNVLITGGSQGLGFALAERLLDGGASVVIVARGEEKLNQVVENLRRKNKAGKIYGITEDVGDKEAIYKIAAQAVALIGPIDLLLNNASTLGPVPLKLLADTECEDFEKVLAVNLLGPFRLIKSFLGPMILGSGGLVINVSSDASTSAYSNWGIYSASKAALDHMTRIFAEELKDTGLKFLSVDPGEMNTEMHADAIPEADPLSLLSAEEVAERFLNIIRNSEKLKNGDRVLAADWSTEK